MYKSYYYLLALICLVLLSPLKRCSRVTIPSTPSNNTHVPESPAQPIADAQVLTLQPVEPIVTTIAVPQQIIPEQPSPALIPEPIADASTKTSKKNKEKPNVEEKKKLIEQKMPTPEKVVVQQLSEPLLLISEPSVKKLAPAAVTEEVKPRTIAVVVDIPEEARSYKHFFGTYKPTTFNLTINGVAVGLQEAITIAPTDTVVIDYYAMFENGRESAKKYTYAIDPDAQNITVTFNWKQKNRVVLEGASAELTSIVDLI